MTVARYNEIQYNEAQYNGIAPTFDWFVASPAIPPRRLIPMAVGAFAFVPVEVSSASWISQSPPITLRKVIQRSGYFLPLFEPIVAYNWLHQQTEIVRLRRVLEGIFSTSYFFEVPVIVPSFAWFEQGSDRFRREIRSRGAFEFSSLPITEIFVGAETVVILGGKTFQYLSYVKPLFPIIAGAVVTFDWFLQQPGPQQIRRRPTGEFILGAIPIVTRGWSFVPPEIPRRRKLPILEGGEVIGFRPISPSFGWFEQQTNIVRKKRIVLEGGKVGGFSPLVSFSWMVPQSDLVRRKKFINEGGKIGGFSPIIPSFSWYEEPISVFHGKFFQYQNLGSPLFIPVPTAPAFDWFQVSQIPIRKKPPVQIEAFSSVFLPSVILDWFIQATDHILRPKKREPGFYARIDIKVADFSWFLETSLPVEKTSFQPPTVVEVFKPRDIFPDWYEQQDNPRIRSRRPEGFATPPPFIEQLTLDKWYQRQENPPLPRLRVPYSEYESPVRFIEEITIDKWWQQQVNPFIKGRKPPSQVVFPIIFFTALTQIIFSIRDCLEAWQIFENSLLPFGSDFIHSLERATASGYVATLESSPLFSGFVEDEDTLAFSGYRAVKTVAVPSGYVETEESLVLSGYVKPKDIIAPSGWIKDPDDTAPWNLAR